MKKSKNSQKHIAKAGLKHHRKKVKSNIPESLDAVKLKKEIIQSDMEHRYDRLFEQKLASQYKEFRELKEHSLQMKKFIRTLLVIVVIILVAVLLLTFS